MTHKPIRTALVHIGPEQPQALSAFAEQVWQRVSDTRLNEADELDALGQRLAEEAACYLQRAAELRLQVYQER